MRFTSLFFSLALPAAATDLVFDTFESDGFGEWAVDGKAFGKSPSATTPNVSLSFCFRAIRRLATSINRRDKKRLREAGGFNLGGHIEYVFK